MKYHCRTWESKQTSKIKQFCQSLLISSTPIASTILCFWFPDIPLVHALRITSRFTYLIEHWIYSLGYHTSISLTISKIKLKIFSPKPSTFLVFLIPVNDTILHLVMQDRILGVMLALSIFLSPFNKSPNFIGSIYLTYLKSMHIIPFLYHHLSLDQYDLVSALLPFLPTCLPYHFIHFP